jgi:acetoin utilization protein AcuB
MTKNRVRDWMTCSPVTIGPKGTVPEARKLMKELSIRRLPVIERGRLVGIVTLGDLREAEASDSGILSKYELKELLAKQTVDRIMTWEPITAAPGMTIQQAARLMLAHKIAGLPIVEDERLIGIITESDIFRVLVQEMALDQAGQQSDFEKVGGSAR